ncbi:hypothetical protein CRG98_042105 [Punica granatum]|uniref:Uncharacterized protein n=1 Tax=Punica granatum TaxID=22663 RepID=A0A2I0I0L5_PUNGR|nr:hypothetical protein CRG98_042105 [Punica granatum]
MQLCAPEFNLVGARMREAYATRLESVLLPGDARRTRQKSRWTLKTAIGAVELPGDCLTSIHAPDPSGLPHRHCLKQGGESGLDPILHSGCAHSTCIGALDPVIEGLGHWTP